MSFVYAEAKGRVRVAEVTHKRSKGEDKRYDNAEKRPRGPWYAVPWW